MKGNKEMKKKYIALLLVLCMILTMLPVSAGATDIHCEDEWIFTESISNEPQDYDYDNNGIVDKHDVELLLGYLTGSVRYTSKFQYADLNEDGKINTYDAYLLLRRIDNGDFVNTDCSYINGVSGSNGYYRFVSWNMKNDTLKNGNIISSDIGSAFVWDRDPYGINNPNYGYLVDKEFYLEKIDMSTGALVSKSTSAQTDYIIDMAIPFYYNANHRGTNRIFGIKVGRGLICYSDGMSNDFSRGWDLSTYLAQNGAKTFVALTWLWEGTSSETGKSCDYLMAIDDIGTLWVLLYDGSLTLVGGIKRNGGTLDWSYPFYNSLVVGDDDELYLSHLLVSEGTYYTEFYKIDSQNDYNYIKLGTKNIFPTAIYSVGNSSSVNTLQADSKLIENLTSRIDYQSIKLSEIDHQKDEGIDTALKEAYLSALEKNAQYTEDTGVQSETKNISLKENETLRAVPRDEKQIDNVDYNLYIGAPQNTTNGYIEIKYDPDVLELYRTYYIGDTELVNKVTVSSASGIIKIGYATLKEMTKDRVLFNFGFNILKKQDTEIVCRHKEIGNKTVNVEEKYTLDLEEHKYSTEWSYDSQYHWHECINCDKIIDKAEHSSSGKATENKPEYCLVCGYVIQPALEHQHQNHLEYVPNNEPTCTKDGNIAFYICSCGKWFADSMAKEEITNHNSVIIIALGHDWDNGKVTKEPSEREHGIKLFTCRRCKETKEEYIAPLGISADRIYGNSRTDTAVEIAKASFEKAENVVLASSLNYADALAGAPLAYAMNAPILLVGKSLDANTQSEIAALGAKNVYILGGTAAVGQGVEDTLTGKGYQVERVEGYSRYDTAAAIAKKLEEVTGKKATEAFIASGVNFPDALAVSSIAAIKGTPILYAAANGKLNGTESYLKDKNCKVESCVILGGEVAVGKSVADNLKACGVTKVDRIEGHNRYDTCLAINEEYAEVLEGDELCVATGTNYPDALAGGVYAAIRKSPVFLVGKSIDADQAAYVAKFAPVKITVFGGPVAVSDAVVEQILEAAK